MHVFKHIPKYEEQSIMDLINAKLKQTLTLVEDHVTGSNNSDEQPNTS